jgi:hypothetical protein
LSEEYRSLSSSLWSFLHSSVRRTGFEIYQEVPVNLLCPTLICLFSSNSGARGCAVGWGTAFQVGRSLSSTLDNITENFHWHNPSGRTMALGSTQPLTKISTRIISCRWRRPVRSADNLTTFMCRLTWNLGALPSWNPHSLSRPIMKFL